MARTAYLTVLVSAAVLQYVASETTKSRPNFFGAAHRTHGFQLSANCFVGSFLSNILQDAYINMNNVANAGGTSLASLSQNATINITESVPVNATEPLFHFVETLSNSATAELDFYFQIGVQNTTTVEGASWTYNATVLNNELIINGTLGAKTLSITLSFTSRNCQGPIIVSYNISGNVLGKRGFGTNINTGKNNRPRAGHHLRHRQFLNHQQN